MAGSWLSCFKPRCQITQRADSSIIRQGEGVHDAAARTYDVLLSIDRITDRTARIGAAQIRVPQGLAGLRVEGYEIPIHATPEY